MTRIALPALAAQGSVNPTGEFIGTVAADNVCTDTGTGQIYRSYRV